ncbi:MAG: hypothetical protein ACFE7R_10170 [Candidatus Hodarchaeota archaeon]
MVVLDILQDTDTGFVNAISEVVAWKYLWRHEHIFCVGLSTRIPFAGTWSSSSKDLCKGLGRQQIDYLNYLFRSERVFDYLGCLRGKNRFLYLIEVKTARRRKFPGTRKRADEISKAKSLGFVPLRVYVRYLDNWKFGITCRKS